MRNRIYKPRAYHKSMLTSVEILEGEPIEYKIERIVSNKEPIKDGAPAIYTDRKDGVISAYNIRTDRWEIAAEAMDKVQGSIQARRDEKGKVSNKKAETDSAEKKSAKVVNLKSANSDVSGADSNVGSKKAD